LYQLDTTKNSAIKSPKIDINKYQTLQITCNFKGEVILLSIDFALTEQKNRFVRSGYLRAKNQ